MAVYTKINDSQLSDFLKDYDIGKLKSFEGIAQGVSNTNYHIFTDKGRYILTLFEERRVDKDSLPFFFAFSNYLAKNGITTPKTLVDKYGNSIKSLAGKPAAILSFLQGRDIPKVQISAEHCGSLGAGLAAMHNASKGFSMVRDNSMGLEQWQILAEKIGNRAEEFEQGLSANIKQEIEFLLSNWPQKGSKGSKALPVGAIHADMFPDNVFFQNGKMSAVIDFYFSCTDFYAYDLAIVINAWCFDVDNNFSNHRYESLIEAYSTIYPMTSAEWHSLTVLCRGAALRILLSRLEEYLEHDPANLMTPHDPGEYIKKLHFHQNGKLPNARP